MDKWIHDNIDKVSIDDLIDYEAIRKKPGYTAMTSFFVCLGPQYYLLTRDFVRVYIRRDLKGKVMGGIIGLFPFAISVLSTRPSMRRRTEFIKALQAKYK